ncbi:hypothetical protein ES702_00595 [subsurface metagenome]
MFTKSLSVLALAAITFAPVQAVVGDAGAVAACQGSVPGSVKCVSVHSLHTSPFQSPKEQSFTELTYVF